MKLLFAIPLLFIATLSYAGTPFDSTAVNQGLAKALDSSGNWKRFFISSGQTSQIQSDLGVTSSATPAFTGAMTATPSITINGSSTSSADTSFAVKDSIGANILSAKNDKSVTVGGTITASALSVPPSVISPTYVNGTVTIGWANTIQLQTASLTLTGATCTVTMSGGGTGTNHCLFINQDSTGTRTASWATAIIKFPGGTTPTLTATALAKDILQFKCLDGINFYCTGFASDVK